MDYFGIDLSQDYVDADLPGGVQRLDQTADGHAAWLAALPSGAVCVLEATGPYGLGLLAALHQAGQAGCVVNPLHGRRFAQRQLRRSKTDRTDAQLLSQLGRAFTPPLHQPSPLWLKPLPQRQALLELLKGQRTALGNHQPALRQSPWPDPVSTKVLDAKLTRLNQQLPELEKAWPMTPRPSAGLTTSGCKPSPAWGRALPWPCCWPALACAPFLAGGKPWPTPACARATTSRAAACAVGRA